MMRSRKNYNHKFVYKHLFSMTMIDSLRLLNLFHKNVHLTYGLKKV